MSGENGLYEKTLWVLSLLLRHLLIAANNAGANSTPWRELQTADRAGLRGSDQQPTGPWFGVRYRRVKGSSQYLPDACIRLMSCWTPSVLKTTMDDIAVEETATAARRRLRRTNMSTMRMSFEFCADHDHEHAVGFVSIPTPT